jgi:iron-sulfur cluster repair protein YtfE (RIC family)
MMPEKVRDAGEILEKVLADHEVLRGMLARIEVLSRDVLAGHYGRAAELREQVRHLDSRFREHLELEESVLAPALLDSDAWGSARVERLHEEHARQREIMTEMWRAGVDGEPNILVFALLAWGFVRMLRADMEEEERISLNRRVLNDDVVDAVPEAE